jgi:glucokinase
MTYLLAGDIGGTKTLLRLVKPESPHHSEYEQIYSSQEYADLVPIVSKFFSAAQIHLGTEVELKIACLAIAGAVIDRSSYLPNLSWHLNADRLQQELHISRVELINDFAAVGYGISQLPPDDLYTLQTGQPQQHAPKATIGAGTGLGEGLLIHNGRDYQVISTEGGHADFAAQSLQEFEFVRYLCQQQQIDRVSNDRVISGRGIVAIYQYLRDTGNLSENLDLANVVKIWEAQTEKLVDPAALISALAMPPSGDNPNAKADPLAAATMKMFISVYGAEAGNLALKILPYGGLYLAGGIAAKNLPLLTDGTFVSAFNHKGRVSNLLGKVPVYVILNSQVGLIGAAARAANLAKM